MTALGSAARRGLLLALVVGTALGCGRLLGRKEGGAGGGGGRGSGAGAAGGTFRDLSEIYGGDGCGAPKKTGELIWQFQHQGETWRVPVWIPPGAGPRDGVVLLHGGGGAGAPFARSSGYVEIARASGAILVAPDAQRPETKDHGDFKLWNTGRPGTEDFGWKRDDVSFLDAIADELHRSACVQDLLGTGFSDGAAMILTWDCRSARHPDAMVTAAGMFLVPRSSCVAKKPVPGRMYIGEKDPRYKSGEEKGGPGVPAVPETAEIFARTNGCEDAFDSRKDAPDTTCRAYRGCKKPLELCVIDGFPHAWPTPPESRADAAKDGFAWFRALGR